MGWLRRDERYRIKHSICIKNFKALYKLVYAMLFLLLSKAKNHMTYHTDADMRLALADI